MTTEEITQLVLTGNSHTNTFTFTIGLWLFIYSLTAAIIATDLYLHTIIGVH